MSNLQFVTTDSKYGFLNAIWEQFCRACEALIQPALDVLKQMAAVPALKDCAGNAMARLKDAQYKGICHVPYEEVMLVLSTLSTASTGRSVMHAEGKQAWMCPAIAWISTLMGPGVKESQRQTLIRTVLEVVLSLNNRKYAEGRSNVM